MKKIACFIFGFCFFSMALAQIVETPEIQNVTVNHLLKRVQINWSVTNNQQVDGYIIKRKIFNGTGVVNNTFNTIATIENNSVTFYEDDSNLFSTHADPYSRSEWYSVVAFKENNGVLAFSNLSEFHNTIFADVVFNECSKRNEITWSKYNGWTPAEYQIYYKNDYVQNYELLASTQDTTYKHLLKDFNISYQYYIKAVSNSQIESISNECTVITTASQEKDIVFANAVNTLNENELKIDFSALVNNVVKDYKLTRSKKTDAKFDTIADLSVNSPDFSYSDLTGTDKVYYYQLVAKDFCNKIIDKSNFACNMVVTAKIDNLYKPINQLQWNHYVGWTEVENYEIFLSFDDSEFTSVETLQQNIDVYRHEVGSYITDANASNVSEGKFCYYVQATGRVAENGDLQTSRSNTVCIYQEPVIYFPTAFNPNSQIEENTYFKPKMSFVTDYHLTVYSGWGNVIFQTETPDEAWNGRMPNGELYMQGTYMYYLKVIDKNGNKTEKVGYVNLVY